MMQTKDKHNQHTFPRIHGFQRVDEYLLTAVCFPYLAKVNFIEDDLIWVSDPPKPSNKGQRGNDCQRDLVVPF